MSEMKEKEHEVTFEEFLQELQSELEYQSDGGTSYRKTTAELSLEIANRVAEVTPFYKLDSAKEIVSNLLPNLHRHRAEDIAKMLNTIVKDLQRKAKMPDEIRRFVQDKRNNNRSPLSFTKKEKGGEEK